MLHYPILKVDGKPLLAGCERVGIVDGKTTSAHTCAGKNRDAITVNNRFCDGRATRAF